MDSVVLVLRGRNGSGPDWRGSDERHQASEGDIDELHGILLAVIGVVIMPVVKFKELMVERGRGGK